jgi:DNA-binding transcriptional regulator YdaS (Cro superfamily)
MKIIMAYMKRHRLSQKEFGKRVGTSQSMVSQWLTGRRPIGAERAVAIERRTKGEISCEDLLPNVFRRRLKGGEARNGGAV